ncbi:MAG TPA: hypothetical protein VMA73_15470 [Streptosporangiaceae bacterium]|nr:hypothetical protein [Streptosporangiaceae bacterium]
MTLPVSTSPARWTRPGYGIAAASALATGVILWSAFPLSTGRAGTRPALAVAIAAGVMSIAQLAAAAIGNRESDSFAALDQAAQWLTGLVKALPWAELLIVAVLVLEVLHASRPWHTAMLGVALTGYLLAVHLTETRSGISVLRAQLPLLCAGIALTALSVGAAALPHFMASPADAAIRIVVLVAAVVAVGLAVPVWLSRPGRPRGR